MKFMLCVILVIFSSSLTHASLETGEQLFKDKCENCHTLERSLEKTKSLSAWKKTTSRMAKYAAQTGESITSAEAIMIAEYLAGRGEAKKDAPADTSGDMAIRQAMEIEKHETMG